MNELWILCCANNAGVGWEDFLPLKASYLDGNSSKFIENISKNRHDQLHQLCQMAHINRSNLNSGSGLAELPGFNWAFDPLIFNTAECVNNTSSIDHKLELTSSSRGFFCFYCLVENLNFTNMFSWTGKRASGRLHWKMSTVIARLNFTRTVLIRPQSVRLWKLYGMLTKRTVSQMYQWSF